MGSDLPGGAARRWGFVSRARRLVGGLFPQHRPLGGLEFSLSEQGLPRAEEFQPYLWVDWVRVRVRVRVRRRNSSRTGPSSLSTALPTSRSHMAARTVPCVCAWVPRGLRGLGKGEPPPGKCGLVRLIVARWRRMRCEGDSGASSRSRGLREGEGESQKSAALGDRDDTARLLSEAPREGWRPSRQRWMISSRSPRARRVRV